MDRNESLRVLKASGYLDMISSWAREGCAPLWFRDLAGALHHASITFVDTGTTVLGVTARHVADEIVVYCDEAAPGRACLVGNAEMSPSSFLARHPSLDLATFRLSHEFVASTGHSPLTAPRWPPQAAAEGELMLFGGYPARSSAEEPGAFSAAHVWFAGHAESGSDRNASMRLRIADSIPAGLDVAPPSADLGGWSGGAVFRVLEQEAIARLELAGIVYEYSSGADLVLAHPLTSIAADGSFEV
jgi:hypothetical protein